MAAVTGSDAMYVKELIGGPLAQGCAAVIAANPQDPIDFLSSWLLQ